VAAPRVGDEPHAGIAAFVAQGLPVRHRRLAALEIHMLARAIGPIHDKRQIDSPFLFAHLAPHERHIALLHLPFLEL